MGLYPCESGGIFGSASDNVINAFSFDRTGSDDTYIPNIDYLNEIIMDWAKDGISFAGLIHSHKTRPTLSYLDVQYARNIMLENKLQYVDMYLYILSNCQLLGFRVAENDVSEIKIEIESGIATA